MARIVLGILLLLLAALSGVFFCGTVFLHGFDEGLARLDELKPEQILYGIGAIFFFVLGLVTLLKRRNKSLQD